MPYFAAEITKSFCALIVTVFFGLPRRVFTTSTHNSQRKHLIFPLVKYFPSRGCLPQLIPIITIQMLYFLGFTQDQLHLAMSGARHIVQGRTIPKPKNLSTNHGIQEGKGGIQPWSVIWCQMA